MGKASKWIRNLLLGKKEEKLNKNSSTSSTTTSKAVVPAAAVPLGPPPPVEKRRWSFGRSSSTDKSAVHKSTRSFDSIISPQLVSQAMIEYAYLQQQQKNHRATTVVCPPKLITPLPSTRAIIPKYGPFENAAATRIQACFRSYLAKKALCALRGLVKLQALVRGHLVRKRTTAMVRCMNALMSIQVRARVQRIQMAEESSYVVAKTKKIEREQVQENMLSRGHEEEMKDMKVTGGIKSHHGYLQTDTIEHQYNTCSSGRVSVSGLEHHQKQQQYPILLPTIHPISRMYDQQVEGHSRSFSQQPTSKDIYLDTCMSSRVYDHKVKGHSRSFSQHYASKDIYLDTYMSSSVTQEDLESNDHQLLPRYMGKTESSRAKVVRSLSEPKQRPVKNKSRRTASNEGTEELTRSSSRVRRAYNKNQNQWLVKLYKSSNSLKNIEFDEMSTSTSNSSYDTTIVAYQPAVTIY